MKFVTLSEAEFRKYAKTSPYKSFYQTPEIGHLREKSGWEASYYGVEKDGKLVGASLIVGKPTFLGKILYYAPGGPLLDLEDKALLNFFVNNLKKTLKNPLVLRFDPYYELTERGREGELIENGFHHEKAEKNLKDLKFYALKTPVSPKYSFVRELDGSADLMTSFKRNTRNHIRKAEKMGVTVRELNREELNVFKQITESTSARRNFEDKSLDYYETMYDLFHDRGEVKFMLAEASVLSNSRESGARQREDERRPPVATGRPDAARESTKTSLVSDTSREGTISSSQLIPMSSAMFMLYGDEVIYLFSGSDEKYMRDYNAQYALQYHMLKYANEHGFKRYNFYGINGLPDPSSKDYGIYEFKKGFTTEETGHVTELIGTYELPLTPLYTLYKLLKKLKK